MAHGRDMAVGVFELLPVLDAVGFQGMRPWPTKRGVKIDIHGTRVPGLSNRLFSVLSRNEQIFSTPEIPSGSTWA